MDNTELEIDDLAFEFFNILLPASKVENSFNNIKKLVRSKNVESLFEMNMLKAELYVADLAQKDVSLDLNSITEISKILFDDIYSWAGSFRTENIEGVTLSKNIEPLLENLLASINKSINTKNMNDEALKYKLFAFAYHSILKIEPFQDDDSNEKLARLFTNYIALKFQYPIFDIKVDKLSMDAADKGDLSFLSTSIKEQLEQYNNEFTSTKLCAAATVTD